MKQGKTQIWKGGLAGLLGQRELGQRENGEPAPAERAVAAPAAYRGGTLIARHGIPGADAATPEASPPPPPSPPAAPAPGQATRILPIEQLLAGDQDSVPPAPPRGSDPAGHASDAGDTDRLLLTATLREARARRIRRAMIAALAALIPLLIWLPDRQGAQEHGPVARPSRTSSAEPLEPAPRQPDPEDARSAAPAPAEQAPVEHQPETAPRGVTRERAAVDALASGNYAAAIRLYRELANRHPNDRVYATAAAILESRATRQW